MRRVLLTGATGFVGSAVLSALNASGVVVRCLTRNTSQAQARWPGFDWQNGDVRDESDCERALRGCDSALYLVHSMAAGSGYQHRDLRAAQAFLSAAKKTGIKRIVYLGGIAPQGKPSRHLRSRIEVGQALREGTVPTLELRASMIIGHGSLSWRIVRDLSARLPAMVLPRWLESRTEPVAIDDVVVALLRALDLPLKKSACFDIPGPQALTGRQILEYTAEQLGMSKPSVLEVPLLSPRLSALWLRLVTRANWSVAREVVGGLRSDVLARDDTYWQRINHPHRLAFCEAAKRALAAERLDTPLEGAWGLVERMRGVAG